MSYVKDVPKVYTVVHNPPNKWKWFETIHEEIDALNENESWILCNFPPGKKAIDNRWVCKVKSDSSEKPERYKARLVGKGSSQRKGFDNNETYAPVAKLTTVRTLSSVLNNRDLSCHIN